MGWGRLSRNNRSINTSINLPFSLIRTLPPPHLVSFHSLPILIYIQFHLFYSWKWTAVFFPPQHFPFCLHGLSKSVLYRSVSRPVFLCLISLSVRFENLIIRDRAWFYVVLLNTNKNRKLLMYDIVNYLNQWQKHMCDNNCVEQSVSWQWTIAKSTKPRARGNN
jgi:hypothetical protein